MLERIGMIDLYLWVRLVNAFVALSCSLYLFRYYLKKETRHSFFLMWAITFMLWGLSIILRLKLTFESPILLAITIIAPFFFILGTSMIIKMKNEFIFSYIPGVFLIVAAYFYLDPRSPIFQIIPFYYAILMTIATILLRKKLGKVTNFFVSGFLLIFISNLLPLATIPMIYADLFSAFAKVLLTYGMSYPRFAFIAWITET